MSDLTKVQETFLEKHQISSSSVFDATGLKPKIYKATMRKLGKVVAFGVTPCKKDGHRLRNRSGHCIQCNPAAIAFQARHAKAGFVYAAGSKNLRLIKIGFSSNVDSRMDSLNYLSYASTSDWVCLYWISSEAAGKLEYESQKDLQHFIKPTSYVRDGYSVKCLETFACSAEDAIKTIGSIAPVDSASWKNTAQLSEYEFQSKKNETKSEAIGRKDSKQKAVQSKAKKPTTELADVDASQPKVISKPRVTEVSFSEGNTFPSKSSRESNKAAPEKSIAKNQSKFSLFEKVLFYSFLVLLFSLASSSHHISRLGRYNADVIETEILKQQAQIRQAKAEEFHIKATSLPSKENLESSVLSYSTLSSEVDRELGESLSESTRMYPIEKTNLGAVPTVQGLGEYIGKNRLALRIEKGPPIKVTEADDYIFWHYQDFMVYINKSDNSVARINEKPIIWTR